MPIIILFGCCSGGITYAALTLGVVLIFIYIARYKRIIESHISNLRVKVDERTSDLHTANQTLEIKQKQLEDLIIIDPLTGIYNRRHNDSILENTWQRSCRENRTLAVAMIDVDYFKPYNDHYGHVAGDNVLCAIAAA